MQLYRADLLNRSSFNIRLSYQSFSKILKIYLQSNSFLKRLWSTVCNITKKQIPSQIFSRNLVKLSKRLFCRWSIWWLLLFLDKNSKYYESCIKQTPPRQLSILFNDSDLREIDLHRISKRIVLKEKVLGFRRIPCLSWLCNKYIYTYI